MLPTIQPNKLLKSEVNKSQWVNEVPLNHLNALSDGIDYFVHYETGGRVDYLGLIGWMANKLNQQEQKIKLMEDQKAHNE